MKLFKPGDNINFDSVSLNPNGVCIYKSYLNARRKKTNESETPEEIRAERTEKVIEAEAKLKHLERISTNGLMSKHAIKKMNRAIGWLLHNSAPIKEYDRHTKKWIKFRVCFVTLTLPSVQIHTDQEIKKVILNSFLEKLRRKSKVQLYLWRAEKQKNGSIHFHLLINKYVPALTLRKWWNDSCELLGYVSAYTEKMKSEIKCFADYYEKFISFGSYSELERRYLNGLITGWTNPNSTDIHSVRKVKNLTRYLSKYMCKNVSEADIEKLGSSVNLFVSGQLWGLSEVLSKMLSMCSEISERIFNEINLLVEKSHCKIISDKFFSFLCVPLKLVFQLNLTGLIEIIKNRYKDVGYFENKFSFYV